MGESETRRDEAIRRLELEFTPTNEIRACEQMRTFRDCFPAALTTMPHNYEKEEKRDIVDSMITTMAAVYDKQLKTQ